MGKRDLFVVLATMIVSGGLFVSPSAAYHEHGEFVYYSGLLTTNEFRTSAAPTCSSHTYASIYSWGTSSAYGTAAVLAPNGTWIATDRNNIGAAFAQVDRNRSDAYKAFCKNSTPWQITVSATCRDWVAFSHSTCV